ncbi:porin [Parashewanella spongiae]|uniref:Porin n=1 Tax=Parashewanella spongiae TaxID=342950 RepID=A0A3A6TGZ2_9GAMM|nr:porin [Parashewanella spongiae]MCL1079814.1 porin [Parashewanella spongiae]RJY06796.1 porin [Parashewanella spongiae]
MKTLNKTILASLVAAFASGAALAADGVTVYGKLNVTAQKSDYYTKSASGEITNTNETKIQSNASRLGVKGGFDLGNSLEAFYTIEYEVDTDSVDKDNFEARNQFIGLKGNFGSVAVGRNDTVTKKSQGKIDQFNDLDADLKKLFKGDNRLAQTVTYLSPTFSNFKFGATYTAEGDNKQGEDDTGISLAAMYGDAKLKKSKIFASIAYDAEVAGYDILRATVQGKIGALKLGGMYQQQESLKAGSESKTGYLVSAAYTIDKITLKSQFQDMEDKGDSWSVGADYKLGKPTKVFAFYSTRSDELLNEDNDYLGVGVEHKF